MSDNKLKPNWKIVRFGDVVHQIKDRVTDIENCGITEYTRGEHFESENLHLIGRSKLGDGQHGSAFHMRFKPGDVLYVSRNPQLRKVAVADYEGICANTSYVFRADERLLLQELLPFIMQTEDFVEYTIQHKRGSTNFYLNPSDIEPYEFLLPPLDEQRGIADLLWVIDGYATELSQLLEKLERIRKSFLFEKFNKLISSKGKLIKVSQAGEVQMGRQLSPQYTKNISPKPYLRVANVYDGYLDLTDVKSMDFDEIESQKFLLKDGDVLLNEGNSRELVGRSCIYRDEIPNCCFQNTLLRFRPTKTSSEYAHYFFQYCQYSGRFASKAKQTTSIAHLGAGRLIEMQFPMPEPFEEEEIVSSLNGINSGIAQLRDTGKRTQFLKTEMMKRKLSAP